MPGLVIKVTQFLVGATLSYPPGGIDFILNRKYLYCIDALQIPALNWYCAYRLVTL